MSRQFVLANTGWRILKTVVVRFKDDRVAFSASALTFTTLLAIVPLVALLLGLLSISPVFQSVSDTIQQFIFKNFIPEVGTIIQGYVQEFAEQARKLSIIGTIAFIITAVFMMFAIKDAINDIWGIPSKPRRLASIISYWIMFGFAPLFMVLSFVATSYLVSLPWIKGTALTLGIYPLLLGAVPVVCTFFVFSLLYIIVPCSEVPIFYGTIGALIATILFEIAKKAFVIYLINFSTYRIVYGALAVIPIFFIWIYCLWIITLFGALITNVLTTEFEAQKNKWWAKRFFSF